MFIRFNFYFTSKKKGKDRENLIFKVKVEDNLILRIKTFVTRLVYMHNFLGVVFGLGG